MTTRSARHATFTIERNLAAAPSRVFKAFADPEAKARWFGGPSEWEGKRLDFEFRVGGRERSVGKPKDGPAHTFDARYYDIVPDERIIYSYDMYLGETRISVSLATVELKRVGSGTKLIFTEQAIFLDDFDDAGGREHGSNWLMDKLVKSVESDSTTGG